ncbi:hypothetical protein ACTFIW_010852 [Dictyostelium discoideum]
MKNGSGVGGGGGVGGGRGNYDKLVNISDIILLTLNNSEEYETNFKNFFYLIKVFNYQLPFKSTKDIKFLIDIIFQKSLIGEFQIFDLSFGVNQFNNFNLFNYIPLNVFKDTGTTDTTISSIEFYFRVIKKN